MRQISGVEVVSDERVGEGGFLRIRRLRLRLRRDDGTLTRQGTYDVVERPMGRDAVVLAIWHRVAGRVEVLLREGLRIPLLFASGTPAPDAPPPRFAELVAGIIEAGEEDEAAIRRRAAAEALEEAGLTIAPEAVTMLGAVTFPTPGMCPERFVLAACEIDDHQRAHAVLPEGDGSPFEEGARLVWRELDEAIAACVRGEIPDLKTECTLRRLRDAVRG